MMSYDASLAAVDGKPEMTLSADEGYDAQESRIHYRNKTSRSQLHPNSFPQSGSGTVQWRQGQAGIGRIEQPDQRRTTGILQTMAVLEGFCAFIFCSIFQAMTCFMGCKPKPAEFLPSINAAYSKG